MVESVTAQRISFTTLFKILYIGHLIFPTLLLIILSFLSLFGFEVFKIEEVYLTGMDGFLKGMIAVPFMFLFALIWSTVFWFGYMISLWLYSKWRPMTLTFIPTPESTKETHS